MNAPKSPLPQPGGLTCPNCGASQATGTVYCTNCGAALAATSPSGSFSTLKIVASILLALAALGLGGFGSCMALIVLVSGFNSADAGFWAMAIVPLLGAAGCVWGIFALNKKR